MLKREFWLRLVAYLRGLVNASAQIVAPTVSGMDAQVPTGDVETVVVNGTKYLLLIIYPMITWLILSGPDLIKVWMGRQYGTSGTVLLIFVLGEIVTSLGYVAAHTLAGITKHGIVASCTAWAAAVNLAASIPGPVLSSSRALRSLEPFVELRQRCRHA